MKVRGKGENIHYEGSAFLGLLSSPSKPRSLTKKVFRNGKTDLLDGLSDQPGGVVDLGGVVDPVPAPVQAGVVLGDGNRHRPPPHRQDGLAKDHHLPTPGRPWDPHLPTPGRLWEAELEVLLEGFLNPKAPV